MSAAEMRGNTRPGWRDNPALTGLSERPYYARLEPNRAIVEIVAVLPVPENGRALDLGSGSGRHSIWLARQGWHVLGIDSSESEVRRCRERAESAGVEAKFDVANLTTWSPQMLDGGGFDLILAAFLHAPMVFRRVAEWLKPGGKILIVLHAPDSPVGPSDPRLRPTLTQIVDSINPPLELLHAERRVTREGDVQLIVHAERRR